MARAAHARTAFLDADAIDPFRLTGRFDGSWAARLAEHRIDRLAPTVARHGGRLVERADHGSRAEFPSAADALGAAIEFQQAVAAADRGRPDGAAVVFRLGLHLGEAGDVADTLAPRRGSIVVSPALRDAVAGQLKASFAELGREGLGTVEHPVHAYEVGWDPADWPAASAAAAQPETAPDGARRIGLWTIVLGLAGLAAVAIFLASAPRPTPAVGGLGAPQGQAVERLAIERRAAAAFSRWLQTQQQNSGEKDEADDEPANPEHLPPADAHDGLYAGTLTTRGESAVVTFKVRVTNGIGTGMLSRLDCGVAPVAFKVSRSGQVSGMAVIFGSTCLRNELAVRGRAVAGTLRLAFGSHFLELSPAD